MTQSYVTGAAVATTLTAPLNNSATSFSVVSATGWPASVPFVIAIDRGTPTEEKILVTARAGTSITNCTRGYDNTTGVSHSVGTNNVEHVISAVQIQELIDHVNEAASGTDHTAAGLAANAVTTVKILDGAVTPAKLSTVAAQGSIGYAAVTANQGGITTDTDLTGLSIAVTVGTGRRIKITAFANLTNASNMGLQLEINEGGTTLQRSEIGFGTAGSYQAPVMAVAVLTPSAGPHTYKLTASNNGIGGTVTMIASSVQPAFILVEDIGV